MYIADKDKIAVKSHETYKEPYFIRNEQHLG